jgi:hypothetical protein
MFVCWTGFVVYFLVRKVSIAFFFLPPSKETGLEGGGGACSRLQATVTVGFFRH